MAAKNSAVFLILSCLLVIISIKEINCQIAFWQNPEFITHCAKGLRADVDNVILKATVYTSNVNLPAGQPVEIYVKYDHQSDFSAVCFIDMTHCSADGCLGCCCTAKDGEIYHLIYNQTASTGFSNAALKLVLDYGTFKVESDVTHVPPIYAPGTEVLTLKVNDQIPDLGSNDTNLPLKQGSNTITVCCSGSPDPCEVTLSVNSVELSGTPCVYHMHTVQDQDEGDYIISHSVCGGALSDVAVYHYRVGEKENSATTYRQVSRESAYYRCAGMILLVLLLSHREHW